MANHKRRRPKHRRAGCRLCKRHKLTANKKTPAAQPSGAGRRAPENSAW